MARSFWKGKPFIQALISPSLNTNFEKQLLRRGLDVKPKYLEELKLHRRNHFLLFSQVQVVNKLPYTLYSGYDYFERGPWKITQREEIYPLNIGASVLTRESKVVHKAKVSKKAATKTKIKQKKMVGSSKKFKHMKPKRSGLTKKFKK